MSKPPASTRYSIRDEIAHGGMGTVLRAWDAELHRHLAMKVMRDGAVVGPASDKSGVDPRLLTRFLEEAQITGQLDHPGIVPVHELGLDAEGRVYFTMKLVQGKTLHEVFDELARGEAGWTQVRVLGLILKVCEALAYAHHNGVIHRDLKPSNIMVGRYGETYVMDWGLAKLLDQEDDKDIRLRASVGAAEAAVGDERLQSAEDMPGSPLLTMDGDVVGTPAYMPPEQARGDLASMGPHSDVYAVGAMLYHLLAGHMPYVPLGKTLSSRDVWKRLQAGPPRPLDELASRAPPELVALCEKAMSRNVSHRYADMSAFSADLKAYLEGRVVPAYEAGAWAEARKWIRRNKPLAAGLVATLLAVVAGSVTFAVQANEARNSAQVVLRLSALQDLEDLLIEADELWPAHPEQIDRLRAWLVRAEALMPQLPHHRAVRRELRALALPQNALVRQQDRESHPDLPRLVALQEELFAKRDALLQRQGGVQVELPAVDWSNQPENASALNQQAWPLVDPERGSFGREAEGLVLARRALERTGDDAALRATIGDTLAWALYSVGRDDEALIASAAALKAAPPDNREQSKWNLGKLEQAVGAASSKEGLEQAAEEIARLEPKLEALETRVGERQDWRFPEEHAEARWWNAQLTKLIEGLEVLADEETGLLSPAAVSPEYGWSIAGRLAYAEELEVGFAEGGRYDEAWAAALPGIHAAYPGLELKPQLGLIPIGPDPDSDLWEFAHLMTGVPAERREGDRKLVLEEETGAVLVLLRGGTFSMGAQKNDPQGQGYDPNVVRPEREGPVREVSLSPFFISKYEMTQGHWTRLTGQNPSFPPLRGREPGPPQLFPVETVSWEKCFVWLRRAGLTLPSDAQWEYAARGGTRTPWFTGENAASLSQRHVANLWDEDAVARGVILAHTTSPEPPDGFAFTAPVGSFAANPFGLHDVYGNVSEFCLDGFSTSYVSGPRLDPVRAWEDATAHVCRGGHRLALALDARSASRIDNTPGDMSSLFGVRPAREVER